MAGPTRSRDELISSFAGSLFTSMLSEVVMDAALQAHMDVVRSRAVCDVCGMRCGSAVHIQGAPSNGAGPSTAVPLAPSSPTAAGQTVTGMTTPTAKDKSDGNVYFECTNCQKKIASNRYAPHLSGCLGIGTGSRRGAARNAAAKNKLGAEPDRSGSPFVGSDYASPPEVPNGKVKGKAKNGKKTNGKAVEFGLNGNNKRLMTPDTPLSKKTKKQKTSTAGSEQSAALVSGETHFQKPHVPTASKRPPKNGTTSASPYAPGSPASASQYSGHDSPSASGSGSSFNGQSPSARLSGAQKTTIGPDSSSTSSKRRRRPPGSGKNQHPVVDVAGAKRKTEVDKEEDPDFIDVDGEDRDESSSDSA